MAKKTKSNSELFASLLYILIGVLLIVFRSQTLGWAMTIAGAFFIISGVLDVLKKNWTGGAISLIIGIAILVLGWLAAQIVALNDERVAALIRAEREGYKSAVETSAAELEQRYA